jgi:hypothetical protein
MDRLALLLPAEMEVLRGALRAELTPAPLELDPQLVTVETEMEPTPHFIQAVGAVGAVGLVVLEVMAGTAITTPTLLTQVKPEAVLEQR